MMIALPSSEFGILFHHTHAYTHLSTIDERKLGKCDHVGNLKPLGIKSYLAPGKFASVLWLGLMIAAKAVD